MPRGSSLAVSVELGVGRRQVRVTENEVGGSAAYANTATVGQVSELVTEAFSQRTRDRAAPRINVERREPVSTYR
jgi:hypothetical protein